MIAALLPVLMAIAPYAASAIGSALGGGKGKEIAKATEAAVSQVVGDMFGTTEPDEVARLAKSNPLKAAELRLELMNIAATNELAVLQAKLSDVADARRTGGQNPLIARAQVAGAAVVLGVWSFMVIRLSSYGLPIGAEEQYAIVLATVSGVMGGILQFFYGNSTSGHSANNTLANLANRAASSVTSNMQASSPSLPDPEPVASVPDKTYIKRRRQMPDTPGAADRLNEEQLR